MARGKRVVVKQRKVDGKFQLLPLVVIAVIVLILVILASNGTLTALISQAMAAAQAAREGAGSKAVVNPLSSVRPLELQAAALRKDSVNLQAAEAAAIYNDVAQHRSIAQQRSTKSNYDRQISQKETQLSAKERQIDTAYTGLYRTYSRDNEALSKIALAQLTTLVRRDYSDKTSTEVPVMNLDCSGGLIEDGLLFKYADAWASNNYVLAASEAGRIAHQFQCLSVSQTLRLDRVITRKIQVQENRFAGNAEAKKLFLAGAFQPLMLSMDANMYLNPESVTFAEQHREAFRSMFYGTSGEQLAQMGLWLINRESGNFEQFNLCTSGSCVIGLDLVYSLQRENLGMGDCKVGEMLKAGPIAGVGFACDREICDAALDIAQTQQILQQINQMTNGILNPSQANQGGGRSPQNAPQNGLPGQTPRVPNLGSGQQTQFGINFGDAQSICSKRRAQGRNAAAPPNPANAPCGVGANSLSGPRSNNQPFRCQQQGGSTKEYYGIGEGGLCKAGQSAGSESVSNTVINNARERYSHRSPEQLANDRELKDIAKRILADNFPSISQAYADEHGGQQLTAQDHLNMDGAIDNAIILDDGTASELCHSGTAIGCSSSAGAIVIDETVADSATFYRSRPETLTAASKDAYIVGILIHESVHAASHQKDPENRFSTADDHKTTDKISGIGGVPTRQCGIDSSEDSCSCGTGQDLVGKLGSCFSTRRNSNRGLGNAGGPIRDPSEGIGDSGSGTLSGIELSCVSGNRASGVPRIGCEAAIQCPGGSYAAAIGGASCSCRAVGYREGLSGNVLLPGGEQCPSGLCPALQNPAQQANRNPGQQVNINNPTPAQNPAGQGAG